MIKTTRQMLLELIMDTGQGQDITAFSPEELQVLMARLDSGQNWVVDKLMDDNPYMFAAYYDLSLDGSERYYLPDLVPWDYHTILMVVDVTGGTDNMVRTVATVWGDRIYYYDNTISPDYEEPWSVIGQNIEFPRKPDTGTMRIWYTRRPKGFFYCTAASGSTTTAVVPASMTAGELILKDDYYIGMFGAVGTEVSRITDYVASTRTFTFTPAFLTAVSSSSVFEMVSPLPSEAQQLIIDKAIDREKISDDDPNDQILRSIESDIITVGNSVGKQQVQSPRYVRKVPRI